MIVPVTYPIKMFGGATFDLTLNWRDREGTTYQLALWTAALRLVRSKSDYTEVLTITTTQTADGVIVLGDTSPNIYCKIEETSVLFNPPDVPTFYLLYLIDQTPDSYRLMVGPVKYTK